MTTSSKNLTSDCIRIRTLIINRCFFFLLGVALFFMGNRYLRYFFSDNICSLSSLIGFSFILLAITSVKINHPPKNISFLCYSFLSCNLLIIINAIFESNFNIKMLWNNMREMMNYLSPFIMLFPFFKYRLRTVLYVYLISCILAILFVIFQWKELVTEPAIINMGFFDIHTVNRASVAATMIMPALLFLGIKNTPKWIKFIIIISACLALLSSLLSGRRSSAFTILLMLMLMLSTHYKNINLKTVIVVVIFGIIAINYTNLHNIVLKSGAFDFLLDRINDNTRTGVETDFIKDFDLPSWLFGRGFYGTYYSSSAIDSFHRNMIETGYLHMILKGGIFYLLLYIVILLRTAYSGIYKGQNSLCKLFGWYAFAHLILLYPGGHIGFNLDFFTLWMSIAFCNNTYLRNLQDIDINTHIW